MYIAASFLPSVAAHMLCLGASLLLSVAQQSLYVAKIGATLQLQCKVVQQAYVSQLKSSPTKYIGMVSLHLMLKLILEVMLSDLWHYFV